MSVLAKLSDGSEARLAVRLGANVEEVVRGLTRDALTGSAVPLGNAQLELEDGRTVRWDEVAMLVEESSFA